MTRNSRADREYGLIFGQRIQMPVAQARFEMVPASVSSSGSVISSG